MADSNTYIIKTVTFKGTSIDGLETVSCGTEGDTVTHGTDGSITITNVFLDNLRATCTVTSRNASLGSTANFQLGQTGSLVITMQQRAAGVGAVSAQDKVITCANATVTSSSATVPHADRSTLELGFTCADPSGASPWAWS